MMILKPRGVPGVCPAHCIAWTPQEDRILLQHYGKYPAKIIAGLLAGRSINGVRHRIKVLRERYALDHLCRPFTADEVSFIRGNAAHLTLSQVAEHLGRHPQTIAVRARKEGIRFLKLGDADPKTKISDDDVRLIRALRDRYGSGITFREIEEKFELPKNTASRLYASRYTREDMVSRGLLRD